MEKIRLFLVDDHEFMLDGITAIINVIPKTHYDFQIMGRAKSADEALSRLEGLHKNVDIAILDISLGGSAQDYEGIQLLKRIKELYASIKVVLFSMHMDRATISQGLMAGMDGYIIKGESKDKFVEALIKAFHGQMPMPPINIITPGNPGATPPRDDVRFTPRELEIICYIALYNLRARDIAERMKIQESTVEVFKRNIMKKMDVPNATGIVTYALTHNLCKNHEMPRRDG